MTGFRDLQVQPNTGYPQGRGPLDRQGQLIRVKTLGHGRCLKKLQLSPVSFPWFSFKSLKPKMQAQTITIIILRYIRGYDTLAMLGTWDHNIGIR